MIDHERKLLFVHIARTGGTSVEKALVGEDWWKIDPATKHISASQARRHCGEEVWREYTTFAIVRNPWDRFVSMWTIGYWHSEETHLGGVKPASFREFLRTLRPHPAEAHQTFHQHQILDEELDFILRFENLQADFSAMLSQRGMADIQLPKALSSEQRTGYRDYYDTETAQWIANSYAVDIERYGYAF
jgi:hypothetical protein